MRVRVLKDFTSTDGNHRAGETMVVTDREAEAWIKVGLVMQDKSLDGPSETKVRDGRKANTQ